MNEFSTEKVVIGGLYHVLRTTAEGAPISLGPLAEWMFIEMQNHRLDNKSVTGIIQNFKRGNTIYRIAITIEPQREPPNV